MRDYPTTLQEAIVYFADKDTARQHLVGLRWENGIICMANKLKSEFVKFQNLLKKLLQVQPTQKPATDKKNPK